MRKQKTEAQKAEAARKAAIAKTYKKLRKLGYSEAAATRQAFLLNKKEGK